MTSSVLRQEVLIGIAQSERIPWPACLATIALHLASGVGYRSAAHYVCGLSKSLPLAPGSITRLPERIGQWDDLLALKGWDGRVAGPTREGRGWLGPHRGRIRSRVRRVVDEGIR